MNYKLNNFINGIIFSKKNIITVMENNKINEEIISINYTFFKKIFIKIKKNNKISLLKLCLDDYSISLAKNEKEGYLHHSKFDKSKFNLLDFEMINYNNDYALSKIDFASGKKGNYFEYNKFYNYNFKSELNNIQLKDYINLMKNKFNITNDQVQDQVVNNLLKFDGYKIPLDVSHGDFIHWNTIKGLKKNYVIDLELFEKNRSYLFDSFHWFLTPIINKMITFNINFLLINSPCSTILKMLKLSLKNNYNKNILENDNLFKILLILFILERYLILNRIINLKNIDELVDEKEKKLSLKHRHILLDLLLKFTKDLIK